MTETSTKEARITPSCVEALQNYEQADYEGIMVLASRQAIHETIDAYWARVDACNALAAERDKWHAGWMEAEAKVSELEAERVVLKAEVERLQSVNELMCAQIDSLPQPEPDLLKRQLRKVADKRVRADLQENTDG